jgi:hypothetical protein
MKGRPAGDQDAQETLSVFSFSLGLFSGKIKIQTNIKEIYDLSKRFRLGSWYVSLSN